MITEEIARTKWCPFTRTVSVVQAGDHRSDKYLVVNRSAFSDEITINDETGLNPTACMASGCMAWRWFDGEGSPERRGFCGLAGQP